MVATKKAETKPQKAEQDDTKEVVKTPNIVVLKNQFFTGAVSKNPRLDEIQGTDYVTTRQIAHEILNRAAVLDTHPELLDVFEKSLDEYFENNDLAYVRNVGPAQEVVDNRRKNSADAVPANLVSAWRDSGTDVREQSQKQNEDTGKRSADEPGVTQTSRPGVVDQNAEKSGANLSGLTGNE